MEMVREEEQAIQSFLYEVFDKLHLSDMEAQQQLMYHMQDETKAQEIMNITQ